ncbi:MAG: RNA polymerase subunit sigma-70 [Blastopirellula sp.]|nr:MAG: RNA polymerase subunit sigma-70 [Blastopirellula sp.]
MDSQLQFVQLLTTHQGRLYAYVLSLVGDPEQARDVMQETNAVLWQKSESFEIGTNFAAWMMKTAYYQVMSHRQKISREKLVFDDELTAELAQAANDQNEMIEEKQDMLRDCLAELNDRHRELIRARYQDGFDLSAIAEKMNRQTNAIKQALFRARANLIDCVSQKVQEASS